MCGDWNFKLLKSIRNSILINFSISEFHQAHTCISIICYILNRATIFNFFFPFKVKITFDSMVLPEISFSNHSESIPLGGKFEYSQNIWNIFAQSRNAGKNCRHSQVIRLNCTWNHEFVKYSQRIRTRGIRFFPQNVPSSKRFKK